MLYTLTIIFENSGYIITCATGYKIGKESQEGLTKKEFLKLLVAPIHLKDARRRQKIKRSLSASVPWILLSMVFILLGAISETLLIVYFTPITSARLFYPLEQIVLKRSIILNESR